MIVDNRYHHLQLLRSSVATLTYPFQYIVNLPSDLTNIIDELLASRHALVKENRMLREENIFNQVKLQRLALLERKMRAWEIY